MRKSLTALVAALSLGVAALAMSSPADARWAGGWGWHGGGWRGGWGWGPGAGFVAGAVIGGALAAPYYGYPYGYYGYGYYPYAYGPGYGPRCQNVWNGYAWTRACY